MKLNKNDLNCRLRIFKWWWGIYRWNPTFPRTPVSCYMRMIKNLKKKRYWILSCREDEILIYTPGALGSRAAFQILPTELTSTQEGPWRFVWETSHGAVFTPQDLGSRETRERGLCFYRRRRTLEMFCLEVFYFPLTWTFNSHCLEVWVNSQPPSSSLPIIKYILEKKKKTS